MARSYGYFKRIQRYNQLNQDVQQDYNNLQINPEQVLSLVDNEHEQRKAKLAFTLATKFQQRGLDSISALALAREKIDEALALYDFDTVEQAVSRY